MLKSAFLVLAAATLVAAMPALDQEPIVPPVALDSAPYAEWAHHHWVWLSANQANRTTSENLVNSYFAHKIRVGAIDLDSGWSTCYNNFVFNEQKYPQPGEMIKNWHDQGVRVILWATSMINTECDIYQEAFNRSFFLRNAFDEEMKPMHWWHGHGGLIDYSNPDALKWWHEQLDKPLSLGIDGWKIDGTDPFMMELVYPRGYKGRFVSYRDYANAYYGDFLAYSRQKLGQDRLIMSRPVDSFGPIFLSFSPKDVMWSGWVGDLDASWDGYKIGLERMRSSSRRGYLNFGTDIAGYRSCGSPMCREQALYMRWFSLGAFCPLMENGGNDDHMPWDYDAKYNPGSNVTTDTYRKMVDAHYSLVPYLLTTGTERYNEQRSAMEFLSIFRDDFRYLLGDNLLVAPPLSNSTTMEMKFLHGANWQNWWNQSIVHKGGSNEKIEVPYTTIPVYQRVGSIIPLSGADADETCEKPGLTRDIIARVAMNGLEDMTISSNVHEFQGTGMTISCQVQGAEMILTSSAHDQRRVAFRITTVPRPSGVFTHDGVAITERSSPANAGCSQDADMWWHHADDGTLTVHHADNSLGAKTRVQF